jgi:hypothetical protein
MFFSEKRYEGLGAEKTLSLLPDIANFYNDKRLHKLGKYSKQHVEEAKKGEMPGKFLKQFVSCS